MSPHSKPIKGSGGNPRGWRGEWAIPFAALGMKPDADVTLPFNLSVYNSEFGEWACWEGTLAETWRLEQGGLLQFGK